MSKTKREAKHTPGPWVAMTQGLKGAVLTHPNGSLVAECYAADAALIASAPELLEIAQLILKEWERPTAGVLPGELIARLSQYSDLAREAIAKATGGAS